MASAPVGGDDADGGLGAGQRRLEVEHALQPRPVAHERAHRRAGMTAASTVARISSAFGHRPH